jgi:hypothetical protein
MARVDDDRRELAAWIKHAEPLLAGAEPKGRAYGGLFMALSIARTSLASDDPRIVASGRRQVPPLINYASELLHRDKEALRRRPGGIGGAKKRAEKRSEAWARYEEMFAALADGKGRPERLKARRRVVAQMTKDEFVDPITLRVPSRQTLIRHFPAK